MIKINKFTLYGILSSSISISACGTRDYEDSSTRTTTPVAPATTPNLDSTKSDSSAGASPAVTGRTQNINRSSNPPTWGEILNLFRTDFAERHPFQAEAINIGAHLGASVGIGALLFSGWTFKKWRKNKASRSPAEEPRGQVATLDSPADTASSTRGPPAAHPPTDHSHSGLSLARLTKTGKRIAIVSACVAGLAAAYYGTKAVNYSARAGLHSYFTAPPTVSAPAK